MIPMMILPCHGTPIVFNQLNITHFAPETDEQLLTRTTDTIETMERRTVVYTVAQQGILTDVPFKEFLTTFKNPQQSSILVPTPTPRPGL